MYYEENLIVIYFFIHSCSGDEFLKESKNDLKENVSLKTLALHPNELVSIASNVRELSDVWKISRLSSEQKEVEMKKVVEPLIQNGRSILNELLEREDLQKEDYEYLQNVGEAEMAQLSMLVSVIDSQKDIGGVDEGRFSVDPRVRSCLATAVGITGVIDLMNNTRSLGSTRTAMKALRLIGRRYLGCVGVGLMVYDFADCYYGAG